MGTRERLDEEMQYEDDRNLRRRQTLNMEEKDNIKGKVELKGGRTEHSRNDGKAEEKTFNSKHSRDGGRGKTTGGWILVKRQLLCLL